jgi:hypothetical protein
MLLNQQTPHMGAVSLLNEPMIKLKNCLAAHPSWKFQEQVISISKYLTNLLRQHL